MDFGICLSNSGAPVTLLKSHLFLRPHCGIKALYAFSTSEDVLFANQWLFGVLFHILTCDFSVEIGWSVTEWYFQNSLFLPDFFFSAVFSEQEKVFMVVAAYIIFRCISWECDEMLLK